jgi:hypothetical protein
MFRYWNIWPASREAREREFSILGDAFSWFEALTVFQSVPRSEEFCWPGFEKVKRSIIVQDCGSGGGGGGKNSSAGHFRGVGLPDKGKILTTLFHPPLLHARLSHPNHHNRIS